MLLNGDCIEEMQKLIDDGIQVDSIVTDPPYHLQSIVDRFGKEDSAPAQHGTDGAFARASKGFMGKEWDGGDIAFRQETWELAMKLLKPGGHLLAFSASRNYHRMAVAIEDAGFEIRDQIMWIYGSGFPKSLNIGKAVDKKQGNDRVAVGERTRNVKPFDDDNGWNSNNTNGNHIYTKGNSEWEGWGTALKPAHEPIVLARKPISEKTIIDNVLKHGTGGINIDECRVELRKGEKTEKKPTKLISSTVNFNASEMRGSVDSKWKLGRFPANVMHDGSDVITKEFPQTGKFGSVKPIDKQKTNDVFGKYNEVKEFQAYDDEGSAARFFYCPKTSKSERGEDNSHPTVKPIALMRYLCRLVTPKGGTVLDPFMGSGSTGMAAKDEGFEFIGIEREKEYFEIAEKRIKAASPLMEFM
jgi:DNA modification methylase|tara:strand:- start:367 stop:1608 length:1242 start_codon:yes stop_codon:yes gene_type:complete